MSNCLVRKYLAHDQGWYGLGSWVGCGLSLGQPLALKAALVVLQIAQIHG